MLRHKTLLSLLVILFIFGVCRISSAEVSPEIQLGARGIMSLNLDYSSGDDQAVSDFSDTSLLVGFRQKLYSDYRGRLVIGFQFPDADSDLGQLFFHQVFLNIENKSNILKIGRSRMRSALIEFPTLRDDDALHFTDVMNPFSSGKNTEDNQYGNVLEATHIFGQRYWLMIHGEHVTESPVPPETSETAFDLNAIGISFEYYMPESQTWNRKILKQIGIGFNNFLTSRPGYSGDIDQALKNIIFSSILNICPDPVHFWDVRHQTIYNPGFSEVKEITDYPNLTRAESISTFTSLRYLYRRLERPTAQLSASVGYKTFPGLLSTTEQIQIIANGFYRIGENFDAGLQFQYQDNKGDVKNLFRDHEIRVQFALVYSIDQLWNKQFDARDSLLNLEHGYIP